MIGGRVKFAIAGMGHIGKRHAQMIASNPDAELVAVCDIKEPEKARWQEQDIPFYRSYHEMLESMPHCDVVNICTPNGLHAQQALEALEKRLHVVVEKPMTLTKAEAEQVIFKSLQVSRHVFGVMQNRYSPPSVWLKEVMGKKLLGNIYFVQLNCFWNRDDRYYLKNGWHGTAQLDGGTLFTQFAHFIDILYWLFGDITNIKASFNDFCHQQSTDFEDSGSIIFDLVNGGMGNLNFSTAVWDKNLESTLTVIGEKGTIKVAGQYMNEVVACHIKDYEMPEMPPSGPPNDYGHYKGSAANHHFVIDNVIQTLRGKTFVTTNALEGLKVVEIIERIYQYRNHLLKK